MTVNSKILILNLPSPPYQEVERDWAGGFGTSSYAPHRGDYGQSSEPLLQSFLPYAASILSKECYDFDIIDSQRLKLNKSQILSIVAKKNPDIIFSIIGLPSMKKDVEFLGNIKNTLPHATIVGVGTVCRVIPDEVLRKGSIDIVLRSGYPYVSNLSTLVKTIEQGKSYKSVTGLSFFAGNKVVSTPNSPDMNLSEILSPSYDSIELEGYAKFTDQNGKQQEYIPILGGKGCPHSCYYCPYPLGFGRKWTYRSPKSIADEMEYLVNVRGIRGFLLREQSFVMNHDHAIKICDEIIQRKLDIAWFCEVRVDQINRELLKKMKDAGCNQINFGVETGDPEIVKSAKSGVNLGTIRKTFQKVKQKGLLTHAHMIIGWPNDNFETIKRTYKFILDLNPDDAHWNVLTPYPGTRLREFAKRNSMILTNDWTDYTSHTVVMRTKYLTESQLTTAKNEVVHNFSKYRLKKLVFQLFNRKKQPKSAIKEAKTLVGSYISHRKR